MASENIVTLKVPKSIQPLVNLFALTLFSGVAIAVVAAFLKSYHQTQPGTLGGLIANHWQVVSLIGGLLIGVLTEVGKAILDRIPRTDDINRLSLAMERMVDSLDSYAQRLDHIERVREDISYFYGKIGGELPHRYGIRFGDEHYKEIEKDKDE